MYTEKNTHKSQQDWFGMGIPTLGPLSTEFYVDNESINSSWPGGGGQIFPPRVFPP